MPLNAISPQSRSFVVRTNLATRKSTTLLLLLAVFLPPTIAFGILYRQALPVPYQDDYKAILGFAVNYEQLPTFEVKALDIATAQYNEYKLSFEHFIVASELELTHQVNFAFLTALGDLFLLPIGYLLWRTFERDDYDRDIDERLLEFLPVSLLFFSLGYWETLNWAEAGLQNIPVVFFSFLSIYLLIPTKKSGGTWIRLIFGCLAAILATCSSPNGFLLGPIGLLILLSRRAYTKSLVWCATFALPLAAYLYLYTPSFHEMHRLFYITRPMFFLAFLGGVVPFRWPAALLGVVILIIVYLAARSRFDRTNPVAFYLALWIVSTACLVAWVRGAAAFSTAPRYSIYSSLLLIFCYFFLARYLFDRSSTFNRKRFYITSLLIAIGVCFAADLGAYRNLGARRRMVFTGIRLYRANPETNSPMIDPLVEKFFKQEKGFEQFILTKAIHRGIYSLPPEQQIR